MIKRETIKQAIDEIARRDPEIGYALDEMLGMGMIDAPAPGQESTLEDDFYFFFKGEKARVSRFLYINKGSVPIEERLLIKYGELLKTQEFLEKGTSIDFPAAAREIRLAGLRLMVIHEIDYANSRLTKQLEGFESDSVITGSVKNINAKNLHDIFASENETEFIGRLIFFLEQLKQDSKALIIPPDQSDPAVLYQGTVNTDKPAFFTHFPFCLESLLQIADINIEFFHVRFILNRLIRNQWQNLFACVVDNRIAGLIYLDFKQQIFYRNLEIEFVATIRAKKDDPIPEAKTALRGVGTFLVAGSWLHWKTKLADAKEMLLDSEIAARRFYDSLGFQTRGLSKFALVNPKGYLLKAIIIMIKNCPHLDNRTCQEIKKHLIKQIKSLRKKAGTEKEILVRKATVATVRECLKPGNYPELAQTALKLLEKYKNKIPESEELIRSATECNLSNRVVKDS